MNSSHDNFLCFIEYKYHNCQVTRKNIKSIDTVEFKLCLSMQNLIDFIVVQLNFCL